MNNLETYQQNINIIFSCLEKLKSAIDNQDNLNFINNLNEYKEDIIVFSNNISKNQELKGNQS